MKFETLIKRLAEKSGTPILEQVLHGERPVTDLPPECMPWTGAKFGNTPRKGFKVKRTLNGLQTEFVSQEIPYGIIRWQGRPSRSAG